MEKRAQIKKLKVLDSWPYTEEWLDRRFGSSIDEDEDKIMQALQSDAGSFQVRYYVYGTGPELAPIQRHINRFIDMVNDGQFDAIDNAQERWEFIDRLESLPDPFFSKHIEEDMDKLHAYQYQNAPREVVNIIHVIDEARRTAKATLDALVKQLSNIAQQVEKEELEHKKTGLLRPDLDYIHKQTQIEMTHSKVHEGIVYVLTNTLMPGVVKIGFTAGNPDRRAADISEQYALPCAFTVAGYVRTKDPYIVEQRIHTYLADCRVSGEFFRIDPEDALVVVRKHTIN